MELVQDSNSDNDIPTFSKSFESPDGYFLIVAGKILPSNGIYRVAVYSFGYVNPEEIEINIASSDNDITKSERVTLTGTNVQNIDFEFKDLPEGDYILNVTSMSGEYFDETHNLHMNLKKYAVLIQTDKSVYKPKDNIKFRIMILDAETKPYKFNNIDVYITDGGKNRIKQFEDIQQNFIKGVYQNDLQLSDQPVMGTWKIHVKVNNDEDITKSFDVDEYVLPKFELSIDTASNVTFMEGTIKATVNAKYTFGKIAKGKATVTAEVPARHYGFRGMQEAKKVSKTVDVDGKKFVEFDLKKELDIRDHRSEHIVMLHASFKDDLSGKEATAKAEVKVQNDSIKMELKKSSEKFKPGLPFTVTAVLSTHNKGTPIMDEKNPVKFIVTSYYDILRRIKAVRTENICGRKVYSGEDYECWEEQARDAVYKVKIVNGIAKLDIDVPVDTTSFSVKAKYFKVEEEIHRIQKVKSICREFLQVKLLTEKPLLSQPLNIKVLTTKKIDAVTYQVHAAGRIMDSKLHSFKDSEDQILIINPTLFMLPKAAVVVYYIAENGEIVSDKIDIEFGNQLLNHINLNLSTEQAKPGDDLIINVNSNPNSYVGLLGVDQSVLLLKKGNDIEPQTVFDELKQFGEAQKYNYSYYRDGHNMHDFSDMILITNAVIEREQQYRNYRQCAPMGRSMLFGAAAPMAMAMKMNAPMEMAMADDMGAQMEVGGNFFGRQRRPVEIRTKFPETWLFDSLEFGSADSMSLTKKVPDTITSWIITGFSLDPVTGLAVTETASKLRVFQPFIVDLNLPYSIKRGEVVSIPVIVFNYLESDEETVVTLYNNDGDFEFVDVNGSENGSGNGLEMERMKEVIVKSNEGVSIAFMIRAVKAGHIRIKVKAESKMAGDGIEKMLKVEPEGVPQYLNEALLIDLRSEVEFNKTIDILIPSHAVPDSTKIELSAIGDILGPSIDNLDKLIKLPYGCGEQNMLNFVPNIVVLDYLTNLKKLTPKIEEKSKKYMEIGYQKELSYKHDDGSYSAFGKSDKSGSTWLTAFVAKSFNEASKYIKIDENVILEALNFLSSVQTENGSFPEVGHVSHRDMQGGSSKGIALTAYTLITFLENKEMSKKFMDVINKAQNYVINNLDHVNDIYSLAIASYALQLCGNDKKDEMLIKLSRKSMNKDGMKYWRKEVDKSSSIDVEMTAYGLQAFIEANQENEAVPIMKWLITQRNSNGGFKSTQDTVVGLQALSKLATKIHSSHTQLLITLNPGPQIKINPQNSLILQKFQLPINSRHFQITATGTGFTLLQISYQYNLDNSGKYPRFMLNPRIDESSNKEFLDLFVCTNFIPDLLAERSNMAVMEVALPSGFTFDHDHMSELMATENVKKVETKDGDTVVMVYFDDIGSNQICPEFKAFRTHAVAKQKPASIIIYDYYDNSRQARTFYNPPEISLCDICEGADECLKACEVPTVEIL